MARFFTGDDGIAVLPNDSGDSAIDCDCSMNARMVDKDDLLRRVPNVLYLLPSILFEPERIC